MTETTGVSRKSINHFCENHKRKTEKRLIRYRFEKYKSFTRTLISGFRGAGGQSVGDRDHRGFHGQAHTMSGKPTRENGNALEKYKSFTNLILSPVLKFVLIKCCSLLILSPTGSQVGVFQVGEFRP